MLKPALLWARSPLLFLAAAVPALAADPPAGGSMKEHVEMGTKGVTPHMTKEKQKELAARQQKHAMTQHMQEGTKGVAPHMTKEKPKEAAAQQQKDAMTQHMQEGTKGVAPHMTKEK